MDEAEEIKQIWQEAGGLMQANVAMTILGVKSKGTMTKWIDKGKLKGYTLPNTKTRMVSYAEVIKLAAELKQKD